MKRGFISQATPVHLGHGPVLTIVAAALTLSLAWLVVHITYFWVVGNEPVVRTNLWLLAGLGIAYLGWIWAVCRGHISAAIGSGLTLAAYALAGRFTTEVLRGMLGPYPWSFVSDDIYGEILLSRTVTFLAYTAGLSLVVSACIAERRLRGQAPEPRKLGGGIRRKGERRLPSVFR